MACRNNFDFLNGCGTNQGTFNYVSNGSSVIKEPFVKLENHVYTPYVIFNLANKVFRTADSYEVTQVKDRNGNILNVAQNAYIQSFELTLGTSYEGNLTIVTCDYSDVEELINLTPKSLCEFDAYVMGAEQGPLQLAYIDIGWVIAGCSNNDAVMFGMADVTNSRKQSYLNLDDLEVTSGPYIYGIPLSVNVTTENGVYKITLKFTDGFAYVEQTRFDNVIFNEEYKGRVDDAFSKIFKYNCDTRQYSGSTSVSKVRLEQNGNLSQWNFLPDDGGAKGPFSYFDGTRLGQFEYVRELINKFVTDQRKGINFVYDNGVKGQPSVLLFEDKNPLFCYGEKLVNANDVPCYIVNGGDCSPVIKFSPSFQATPVKKTTDENPNVSPSNLGIGGGGSAATGQASVQINDCVIKRNPQNGNFDQPTIEPSSKTNGTNIAIPASPADMTHRTPDQIVEKRGEAIVAQITSSFSGDNIGIVSRIQAELEIHGDPYWANTLNLQRIPFIKIVFINVPCVQNQSNACEYLDYGACNKRLSGLYYVKSARHTINSGSYTTTLDLHAISVDISGEIGKHN